MPHPYDSFAPYYGAWTASAPVCAENLEFYRGLYLDAAELGPVVELGVGDGRIALEACTAGARVIGVDASAAMLDLCRGAARERGIEDKLELLHADFREYQIAEPAALIALPFHSIGHLVTLEDKLAALRHARANLQPDGRFVFDHFIADEAYARARQDLVLHRASCVRPDGRRCHIFASTHYDFAHQRMQVLVRADTLEQGGAAQSVYSELDLSWLTVEQSQRLLSEAGFRVESLHGGFAGEPFTDQSRHQVWIARPA